MNFHTRKSGLGFPHASSKVFTLPFLILVLASPFCCCFLSSCLDDRCDEVSVSGVCVVHFPLRLESFRGVVKLSALSFLSFFSSFSFFSFSFFSFFSLFSFFSFFSSSCCRITKHCSTWDTLTRKASCESINVPNRWWNLTCCDGGSRRRIIDCATVRGEKLNSS